jgi:hypothetical protein
MEIYLIRSWTPLVRSGNCALHLIRKRKITLDKLCHPKQRNFLELLHSVGDCLTVKTRCKLGAYLAPLEVSITIQRDEELAKTKEETSYHHRACILGADKEILATLSEYTGHFLGVLEIRNAWAQAQQKGSSIPKLTSPVNFVISTLNDTIYLKDQAGEGYLTKVDPYGNCYVVPTLFDFYDSNIFILPPSKNICLEAVFLGYLYSITHTNLNSIRKLTKDIEQSDISPKALLNMIDAHFSHFIWMKSKYLDTASRAFHAANETLSREDASHIARVESWLSKVAYLSAKSASGLVDTQLLQDCLSDLKPLSPATNLRHSFSRYFTLLLGSKDTLNSLDKIIAEVKDYHAALGKRQEESRGVWENDGLYWRYAQSVQGMAAAIVRKCEAAIGEDYYALDNKLRVIYESKLEMMFCAKLRHFVVIVQESSIVTIDERTGSENKYSLAGFAYYPLIVDRSFSSEPSLYFLACNKRPEGNHNKFTLCKISLNAEGTQPLYHTHVVPHTPLGILMSYFFNSTYLAVLLARQGHRMSSHDLDCFLLIFPLSLSDPPPFKPIEMKSHLAPQKNSEGEGITFRPNKYSDCENLFISLTEKNEVFVAQVVNEEEKIGKIVFVLGALSGASFEKKGTVVESFTVESDPNKSRSFWITSSRNSVFIFMHSNGTYIAFKARVNRPPSNTNNFISRLPPKRSPRTPSFTLLSTLSPRPYLIKSYHTSTTIISILYQILP